MSCCSKNQQADGEADVKSSCCAQGGQAEQEQEKELSSCCDTPTDKPDWFLRLCLLAVAGFYGLYLSGKVTMTGLDIMALSVYELINTMWWSVFLAALFVGLLAKIPQPFVVSILGRGGSVSGLLRATLAGVLMDLCSHGILMVGMQLHKKGASLGQVMAFLVASPWNSLSLTLILVALIGLPWTLAFIALSMVLALTTGWIFERLVANGTLPGNPNTQIADKQFRFWPEAKQRWAQTELDHAWWQDFLQQSISGSKMVLRWLLFGVLLAAMIRGFVSMDNFQAYFGPSLMGLAATLLAATIIEVCSEGSTPIAADLMTRGGAPGNSFAFLMTGVATDYTEVMVIRDTMKSWKIALFLPLVCVPQVVAVAVVLNQLP